MPRNSSGTYSLPVAAYVSGTTIRSADMNTNLSDIATALTQSLSTTGVSSMSGALLLAAGTALAPSLTLASDDSTGWYNNAAGAWTFVSVSVPVVTIDATGVTITGALSVSGTVTFLTAPTFTSLVVTGTTTPLTVRNTTNDASEHTLESYQLGSGAGVKGSLRAIGTGVNDLTQIRHYLDSTEVFRYSATTITLNLTTNISTLLSFDATGFIDQAEIAAPAVPSANVLRIYTADDAAITRLFTKDASGNVSTLFPVATQADQETATSNKAFVTPGVQKFSPLHPKCWVVYNMVTTTILASSGISGVVLNATGDLTVSFTTAFSSTAYGAAGWCRYVGTNPMIIGAEGTDAKLVGSMQFSVRSLGAVRSNSSEVTLVFFGDV